jgi:peptidoglycan/xylan/chitin deacetylase (PgdA/CDA1 family)
VVSRITTDARVVALTFDAGSDLGYTSTVLDVLAERDVLASFGITGAFAEAHPDHVTRMAREGHVVMNHSYSHASFTGVSSDDVLTTTAARQADLLAADAILGPLVGGTTRPFWRPPFGDHDASVLADVGAIGYGFTVMWTFDSLGWQGLTADAIVERVLGEAQPGAIVVLHVGSQSQDALALPAIIDGLRTDGYSFTTVRALTGWA